MSDLTSHASQSDLLLSVVVPVYNEAATVESVIATVLDVDVDKEIVVVDDHSTDGTHDLLKSLAVAHPSIHVWRH